MYRLGFFKQGPVTDKDWPLYRKDNVIQVDISSNCKRCHGKDKAFSVFYMVVGL